jgi:hypothetical protein
MRLKVKSLASFAMLLPLMAWADGPAGGTWTWADRPFDGSWVIQPELTTFGMRSPILSLERGVFRRTDCRTEPIDVPADGAAHGVRGQALFDTISVRVLDPKRVEVVEKSADKLAWKGMYTVSANGRAMRLDFEDDRAAKPVTGALEYVREGDARAGAHSVSGTWRPEKLTRLSSSGLTVTLAMQRKDAERDLDVAPGPDFYAAFTLAGSDGRSAEGKLDTHDYPLNGYLPGATIALNRLQPNILQFNRSQNGVLVELTRAMVASDGQTMTLSQIDWVCQAKTVLILNKQAP